MNIFDALKFSNLIVESSPIATLKDKLSSKLSGKKLQDFLDAVQEYKTNQNVKDYINRRYGQSLVRTFVDQPTLFVSEVKFIKSKLYYNKKKKEYNSMLKNSYKPIIENDEYEIFVCFIQRGLKQLSQISTPLSEDNFVENHNGCGVRHPFTYQEYANFLANSKFCLMPSWCIAGSMCGPHFWNSYHLSDNSLPQVFLVQSKIHRNWRFTITLNKDLHVSEIRDPWQVFGKNKTQAKYLFNACFKTDFSSTMRLIKKYLRLNSDELSNEKKHLKSIKNPFDNLHDILKKGNVKKYIEMGGDPNTEVYRSLRPLNYAKNPKDVLYLINKGANPFLTHIFSRMLDETLTKREYDIISTAIITSFKKYFDKNDEFQIDDLIDCYMCQNLLRNCKEKFLKDFISCVPQVKHPHIFSHLLLGVFSSFFEKDSKYYCGKERGEVLDDFVNAGCKFSDQDKSGWTCLQHWLRDENAPFSKGVIDVVKPIADKNYDATGTKIAIWKIASIISIYEINDKQLDYLFKYSVTTKNDIHDIFPYIVMGNMTEGITPIVKRFFKLYKEKVGVYTISENDINVETNKIPAAKEILKYMKEIGYTIDTNK